MAEYANGLVLFTGGRGSASMFNNANKLGLNVQGLPPVTESAPPILVEVPNHPPASTPER